MTEASQHVTGEVRLRLHGGRAVVTGRRSPAALYDYGLATYDTGDTFDQAWPRASWSCGACPARSPRTGPEGAGETGRHSARLYFDVAARVRPCAPGYAAVQRSMRGHEQRCPAEDRRGAPRRPALGRPVRLRPGGGAGPAVGQRPVRLAAGPLRPARLPGARPGAAPGRPAGRRRAGPDAGRARRPRRSLPDGRVPARPPPTRTCTPRWSAGCWSGSARSAASCGPAAAATTRSPPTCGCTCATTPG